MANVLFVGEEVTTDISQEEDTARPKGLEVGLLTGGQDRHYAFGLATALAAKGVQLEVIGSDDVYSPELQATPGVKFLNLRGGQRQNASMTKKIFRVLLYYTRLIGYAATARPKIFHILWNNRLEHFDRTLLLLYYKLLGKKLTFTAHNINVGRRDSKDSLLNRLTLRIQYRLVDNIFVHTEKMKRELLDEYGVQEKAVTVIPYGINNAIPQTDLSPAGAKQRLGIQRDEKTILFFGNIAPYKGLDLLVSAFLEIAGRDPSYRLIIAGKPKKGCEKYLADIQEAINCSPYGGRVIQKIAFIPDEETEVYYKAADVLALPYTEIFQSGILFWGYSFGIPVVAADVGSFREDVLEGRTGFLCKPGDSADLAWTIEKYFASDLFRDLKHRRREVREYAHTRHSWGTVARITRDVYAELLGRGPTGSR